MADGQTLPVWTELDRQAAHGRADIERAHQLACGDLPELCLGARTARREQLAAGAECHPGLLAAGLDAGRRVVLQVEDFDRCGVLAIRDAVSLTIAGDVDQPLIRT